jgi:phytoene dehydrogenase-like protein
MPTSSDIVVVGAGLAGLRCAAELEARGLEVTLLEASDGVGGRVRTDRVDDFLCDRGFQLLNPAYPAVKKYVDVPALGLQTFEAGVAVRRPDRLALLGDPRRAPGLLRTSLTSGMARPSELAALARFLGPALIAPQKVLRQEDEPLGAALDRAGVDGPLRRDVLEPFLAGVLADSSVTASANLVRMLARAFALGTPGLPARGMQALPDQLASRLRAPARLGVRVTGLRPTGNGVEVLADGDSWSARSVVVAVGPDQVESLVPDLAPPTRGLATWWFAADEAPFDRALLTLDAREVPGPAQHAAVVSKAAPSYAPQGRHLIQATVVLDRAPDATEADVRRQLGELWDADASTWELIMRHDVPHALPFQPAPLVPRQAPKVGARTYLTGDHRDTASIQGALVSGTRIARAVLGELGVRPTG